MYYFISFKSLNTKCDLSVIHQLMYPACFVFLNTVDRSSFLNFKFCIIILIPVNEQSKIITLK